MVTLLQSFDVSWQARTADHEAARWQGRSLCKHSVAEPVLEDPCQAMQHKGLE